MASEKQVYTETFIAGEDLSDYQYHGVKMNGNRTVDVIDADTDVPIGILLNDPDDGEEALVMIVGRSPVVVGEALTAGTLFAFDANGEAEPWAVTDTDQYPAGKVISGAAAAEKAEVVVGVGSIATA